MTLKPHIHIITSLVILGIGFTLSNCSEKSYPRDTSYTIANSYSKIQKNHSNSTIALPTSKETVSTEYNIAYHKADGRSLRLDVFSPKIVDKNNILKPVILMIHGGGWSSGSRDHMYTMATELATRDFVAVPIEYRLSPEKAYPAAVQDLFQGISWIRKNITRYNGDKSQIYILGASAGAQLASLIGITENTDFPYHRSGDTEASSIKGIINIDGIVSFIHPEASAEGISAAKWLGGSRETHWNNWVEASPLEHVSYQSPPILFINGSAPRFHAGRDSLISRYNEYGIYSDILEFQDAPHTFWFFNPWFEPMVNKIEEFLLNDQSYDYRSFPEAEGYGSRTVGGNKGKIIFVDNLNDSGPGSLRAAVKSKGARIVVFRVSGYIRLKSTLEIKNDSITIAGQTAPGDGICIRDKSLDIDADQVIIRYMRFRLGDESNTQSDALSCRQQKNIILDHCSLSWSVDETLSIYTNQNTTVQWCIISESLNNSIHSKGAHGYGGIWGGVRASFHHNLIAHHKSRTPRFSGLTVRGDVPNRQVDFYNNVIYNWRDNSTYGNEAGQLNMVNNYYKPGPATSKNKRNRIIEPYLKPSGKLYLSGNIIEGYPDISQNNWSGGVHTDYIDSVYNPVPFDMDVGNIESAESAYTKVLKYAGASLSRDAVDQRIISEVSRGTTTYTGSKTGIPGIIDSQNDVGGWLELFSSPYPEDTDMDGLPDHWETRNNLNPQKPNTDSKTILNYLNAITK